MVVKFLWLTLISADLLPTIWIPDGAGGTRLLDRNELLLKGYISEGWRRYSMWPKREDSDEEGPQLDFYAQGDCGPTPEAVERLAPEAVERLAPETVKPEPIGQVAGKETRRTRRRR